MTRNTDGPRRRQLLAALATGSLAGCTGLVDTGTQQQEPDEGTATESPTTTAEPQTATQTAEPTDTPEPPDCSAFHDLENWIVWEGTGETVRNADRGECGVQLHCDPPEERIAAMFEEAAMDLSSSHLTFSVRYPDEVATPTLEVWLAAPDLHSRYVYHLQPKPGAGWVHRPLATPDSTYGGPDPSDVQGFKVIQYTENASQITVEEPDVVDRPPEPTVLFTFDSGRSSVTTAASILDEYGYAGSVGVAPKTVGESGYLSVDQLEDLATSGWDVMNQPQTIDPLRAYSRDTQAEILTTGTEWLRDHGFDDGARFCIYPHSAWDSSSRATVGELHRLGFAGHGTSTWQPPTPARVGRIDGTDPDTVTEYLDRLEQFNGVVPLRFGAIGDGDGSISEAAFRDVVRSVDRASGVRVMNVGQWYDASRTG